MTELFVILHPNMRKLFQAHGMEFASFESGEYLLLCGNWVRIYWQEKIPSMDTVQTNQIT